MIGNVLTNNFFLENGKFDVHLENGLFEENKKSTQTFNDVDCKLYKWLKTNCLKTPIYIVGYNTKNFDMKVVLKYLPKSIIFLNGKQPFFVELSKYKQLWKKNMNICLWKNAIHRSANCNDHAIQHLRIFSDWIIDAEIVDKKPTKKLNKEKNKRENEKKTTNKFKKLKRN
jgi:oligoribonuclease (3'-5' exoribonuclease)